MSKQGRWTRMAAGLVAGLALATAGANASAADPLPQEVTIRGVEFVLIPAGEFYRHPGLMGEVEPEGEMVKVWLDAYYIAKHEARARDLMPFMNETKPEPHLYAGNIESCSMVKGKDGDFVLVTPWLDLPATHLSWRLADAWARWMGFRLPTEGEWEKAARGTDKRIYPWGNDEPDDTYTNFYTPSSCLVWPVDRAAKGRSPYGIYNMAGNVREFIADWHEGDRDPGKIAFLKYVDGEAQRHGLARHNKKIALMKGGRWASSPLQLKISYRQTTNDDEDAFQCNGTRFALDAAVVREHLAKGSAVVTRQ